MTRKRCSESACRRRIPLQTIRLICISLVVLGALAGTVAIAQTSSGDGVAQQLETIIGDYVDDRLRVAKRSPAADDTFVIQSGLDRDRGKSALSIAGRRATIDISNVVPVYRYLDIEIDVPPGTRFDIVTAVIDDGSSSRSVSGFLVDDGARQIVFIARDDSLQSVLGGIDVNGLGGHEVAATEGDPGEPTLGDCDPEDGCNAGYGECCESGPLPSICYDWCTLPHPCTSGGPGYSDCFLCCLDAHPGDGDAFLSCIDDCAEIPGPCDAAADFDECVTCCVGEFQGHGNPDLFDACLDGCGNDHPHPPDDCVVQSTRRSECLDCCADQGVPDGFGCIYDCNQAWPCPSTSGRYEDCVDCAACAPGDVICLLQTCGVPPAPVGPVLVPGPAITPACQACLNNMPPMPNPCAGGRGAPVYFWTWWAWYWNCASLCPPGYVPTPPASGWSVNGLEFDMIESECSYVISSE